MLANLEADDVAGVPALVVAARLSQNAAADFGGGVLQKAHGVLAAPVLRAMLRDDRLVGREQGNREEDGHEWDVVHLRHSYTFCISCMHSPRRATQHAPGDLTGPEPIEFRREGPVIAGPRGCDEPAALLVDDGEQRDLLVCRDRFVDHRLKLLTVALRDRSRRKRRNRCS